MQLRTTLDELISSAEYAIKLAREKNVHAEIALLVEQGFTVSARAGDVENVEHLHEKGLSLTVYDHQRMGGANSTDFSKEAIQASLEKAIAIAQFTGVDAAAGLAEKADLAQHYPDLQLHHPWSIGTSEAIQMAIECEAIARATDVRIKESEGASVSTSETLRLFANTDDFFGYFPSSMHALSCTTVAEDDNGEKERDYEYSNSRVPDQLESLSEVGKKAALKTIARMGARKIPTQHCPVIFEARVAKSLWGGLVSAISGSNLYRETSFLLNRINTRIFPEFIDVYQRPHVLHGLASSPFDTDGVRTMDRHYVKNGELVSYVMGSYSARKLNLRSTGNAGGVYNLFISHSDLNLKALIKKMHRGLLVTEMMGQGLRLITGDYSRGATGFWIDNGEIQFPVFEITISGNLEKMFSQIVAIGNDVDHRGNIQTGSVLIEDILVSGG